VAPVSAELVPSLKGPQRRYTLSALTVFGVLGTSNVIAARMPLPGLTAFSRTCGRLRSKPMWTFTHPKKRPCGYAVDMLRTTRALAQVCAYFNELLIDVNLVLSFVPSPFTAAMIASAMPAAINPYSIAVAPDSSAMNFRKISFMQGIVLLRALIPSESNLLKSKTILVP
jgi:hypothetical protein